MHNDIHRQSNLTQMSLHRGSHPSPDAVAFHCSTQDLTDCESYSRPRVVAPPAIKHRDVSRKMFPAFFVHHLKICVPEQSGALGKLLQRLGLITVHGAPDPGGPGRSLYSRKPGFTETRLRPLARRRDSTA